MFKNLLLVALTSMSYASAFTLGSSNNVNRTYSQNDFIASDSLTYRLGDYQVTELEHTTIGSSPNTVSYGVIQVSVPYSLFETLGQYDQVYISILNFSYNPNVMLFMSIEFIDSLQVMKSVYDDYSQIPLSETMLANFGYTIVDLPITQNLFAPALWDYIVPSQQQLRLTFNVPYTPYSTDPPYGWQDGLRDITLFTKLSSYYDGYSDGYSDGVSNGYNDGFDDGYSDGYPDGYIDGIAEGITQAEGTWLGNLIFGTVGSVVGFIFAISDFEVLGVSIMSIITLFVAIGVIMLFIKLIKGTN